MQMGGGYLGQISIQAWSLDKYAQDSRFYSAKNRVKGDKTGECRRLTVIEEERLMGLGGDYQRRS